MNKDVPEPEQPIAIPASAAEAWAEVYIDVAEKLDAEERQAQGGMQPDDAPQEEEDVPCPSA